MPYRNHADKYARRQERIASGLCRDCSNQAEVGQLCGECHAKKIAHERIRRPPTGNKRGKRPQNPTVAFWGFVNKDGPMLPGREAIGNCWMWTGAGANGRGYGSYNRVESRAAGVGAHRVAYWLATGIVPVVIDHLCENRLCVRPSHLEDVGTPLENNRRWRESPLRQSDAS